MSSSQVQTALFGIGTGGRYFHAPLLEAVQGFKLRYIFTRSESNKRYAREFFPEAEVMSDASIIWEDKSITLVVIATPNHTHFELAARALRAGKNVVIDKPFAVDSAETHKLMALAESQKLQLSVFHNRRWDGDFQYLKEKIESGALGQVKRVYSHFHRFRKELRPDSWKEQEQVGSGLLYDLGSHLIDQSLQLFGIPQKLWTHLDCQRPGAQTTDFFELHFFYRSGLLVTLSAGMLQRPPSYRFEAIGTQATLAISGLDPQENLTRSGVFPKDEKNFRTSLQPQSGTFWEDTPEGFSEKQLRILPGDYKQFYCQLYQALQGDGELPVSALEAALVIQLIERAEESHRLKQVLDVKID